MSELKISARGMKHSEDFRMKIRITYPDGTYEDRPFPVGGLIPIEGLPAGTTVGYAPVPNITGS